MIEDKTMRPKEKRAMRVTLPPNQRTSPYAMRMMVKFLKMVYTGMERNLSALVEVYIIPISRREMGNPLHSC
jgi:hypothetical protein